MAVNSYFAHAEDRRNDDCRRIATTPAVFAVWMVTAGSQSLHHENPQHYSSSSSCCGQVAAPEPTKGPASSAKRSVRMCSQGRRFNSNLAAPIKRKIDQ